MFGDDDSDQTDQTLNDVLTGATEGVTSPAPETPLLSSVPSTPTPLEANVPVDTTPPDAVAQSGASYDPSMQISADYTLADLCVTSQTLTAPNLPINQAEINNLGVLAQFLETLTTTIGPFTILSGFRSPELEAVLTAQGEPTAPGLSFHELGRAADLAPTTMTIDQMFGQILANSNMLSQLVEIAWKPSQNSIHLAVNTPDDTRVTKVLTLNSGGIYAQLTADEIEQFIQPYVTSSAAAVTDADNIVSAQGGIPLWMILVGAGAIAYFLFAKSGKVPKAVPSGAGA